MVTIYRVVTYGEQVNEEVLVTLNEELAKKVRDEKNKEIQQYGWHTTICEYDLPEEGEPGYDGEED